MSRKNSGSKKIGLKSQILVTMGSVLFLFALVLGFFFYVAAIMPGQKTDATKSGSVSSQGILQLQSTLAEAQQIANMFFLTGDPSLIEKHKTTVSWLVNQATKFKQASTKGGNKKDAAAAGKIISQAQSYSNLFQQLAKEKVSRGNAITEGLGKQLNTTSQAFYSIIDRNDVSDLALAVIELQVQQEDYLRTNRSASLQNLMRAKKKLERVARETKIDMLEAQLIRKNIRNYASALDRYQAVSLATNDPSLSSTLGKEQSRQADAVKSAASDIQAVVARVSVPSAASLSSAVRKAETDFLLYGGEQNITTFNRSLDALINAFNTSSILQEHKEELVKASVAYRSAFQSLADSQNKIKDLTADLNKSSSSIATVIAALSKTKGPQNKAGKLPIAGDNNLFLLIAAVAGLIVILIGFIAALVLGNSIAAPITSITRILQRIIRDQDFSIEIPATTKNEIGALAEELNNLLDLQDEIAYQSYDASDSFSSNFEEIYELGTAIKNSINDLVKNTREINQTAIDQEEKGAAAVLSIDQITAAASSITRSENPTPDNDQDEPVSGAVEKINQSLDSALESIQSITDTSAQISDIIAQSADIAEQTNLLALNASVKAARAGSHGKEFSAIADGIAKLAQRSEELAKEAREISETLSERISQSASLGDDVKEAMENIKGTGQAVQPVSDDFTSQIDTILQGADELSQIISKFSTAIQEIATISQEQVEEYETAQSSLAKLLDLTSKPGESTRQDTENGSFDAEKETSPRYDGEDGIDIAMDEESDHASIDNDEHDEESTIEQQEPEIDEGEEPKETK